ncbi:MAG: nuclear transport factor 2 family protein [Solirubrobacterales bacterium]
MTQSECVTLIDEFTRAWVAGDVDFLMELMSGDCEFRASVGPEPGTSFVGREAVRRGFERYLGSVGPDRPKSETETLPLLVGPDFAVTRWIVRTEASDGNLDVVHGCDVFEFEGDRIRLKDTYRKVAA